MKLHHIRTYITVIDQSSISSAARRLSLTPSTVSAHIKALENEFGIELFTRSQRGVELTESGRKLEKQARLILQAAADFAAQAQSCRKQVSGRLRLALSVSSNVFDLPAFVRRLDGDFPGIDLQLSHDESMRESCGRWYGMMPRRASSTALWKTRVSASTSSRRLNWLSPFRESGPARPGRPAPPCPGSLPARTARSRP